MKPGIFDKKCGIATLLIKNLGFILSIPSPFF